MIKVLCLGKDSPDARRLLNYRAVKTARGVCLNLIVFFCSVKEFLVTVGARYNSVNFDKSFSLDLCVIFLIQVQVLLRAGHKLNEE